MQIAVVRKSNAKYAVLKNRAVANFRVVEVSGGKAGEVREYGFKNL